MAHLYAEEQKERRRMPIEKEKEIAEGGAWNRNLQEKAARAAVVASPSASASVCVRSVILRCCAWMAHQW